MACQYQRFIQMTRRNLGLDDDTYRALLESVTGKDSTTKMTVKERWRVVEALKAKGVTFKANTNSKSGKPDASKAGDAQSRLVRHLWLRLKGLGVLRDSSEWALLAYVERITGRKRMEWCTNAQMTKLIKSLEQWLERVAAEPRGIPGAVDRHNADPSPARTA